MSIGVTVLGQRGLDAFLVSDDFDWLFSGQLKFLSFYTEICWGVFGIDFLLGNFSLFQFELRLKKLLVSQIVHLSVLSKLELVRGWIGSILLPTGKTLQSLGSGQSINLGLIALNEELLKFH